MGQTLATASTIVKYSYQS